MQSAISLILLNCSPHFGAGNEEKEEQSTVNHHSRCISRPYSTKQPQASNSVLHTNAAKEVTVVSVYNIEGEVRALRTRQIGEMSKPAYSKSSSESVGWTNYPSG